MAPRVSLREQCAVAPPNFIHQISPARNTRIFTYPDDTQRVVLHRTIIVVKNPDDSVTLTTEGWTGRVTRDRMNDHLPPGYVIRQHKGDWTITHPNDLPGTVRPFVEGMTLHPFQEPRS